MVTESGDVWYPTPNGLIVRDSVQSIDEDNDDSEYGWPTGINVDTTSYTLTNLTDPILELGVLISPEWSVDIFIDSVVNAEKLVDVGMENIQVGEAGFLLGETCTLCITRPSFETPSPILEPSIEQLGSQAPMPDML